MYKNFLEEIILTGCVNNNYFDNLPNNLLILQNNLYILSVLSTSFVCKIIIHNTGNSIFKIFDLPINNDSRNLIINWGDNSYTLTISLHCKLSNQLKLTSELCKGDCYFDKNKKQYIIYTGNSLEHCDYKNINPLDLTESHQILINSSNKKILKILLIDTQLYSYYSHSYRPGTYYIKIKGGFTGFTNKQNNNKFYITCFLSKLDTNTGKLVSIERPSITLELILSWGSDTCWNTLENAFNSASELKSIPSAQLPNVNSTISCFYNCKKLNIPHYKNLLPNALISSISMFLLSGLSGDLNYLMMQPYNTVIDRMFACTNTSAEYPPYNYNYKHYYSGDNSELSSYSFSDIHNSENIL